MQGILLIDKSTNKTSYDVVEEIKNILRIKKVGHTGTLDPFASGLLVIGIGKGTRILEYLSDGEKEYYFTAKLGIITDTYDITGKVTEEHEVNVSEDDIKRISDSMRGKQKQVPPAYSAKKYQGKRLYELAREGKIISLPPREIEIKELQLIHFDERRHLLCMKVIVSKGTYIRSLCADMGYRLGCGATAIGLRRTKNGRFDIKDAIKDTFLDREKILKNVKSIDESLSFPGIVVDENAARRVANGMQVYCPDVIKVKGRFKKNDHISIWDVEGHFLAIATAERSSRFISHIVKAERRDRVAKLKKVF